jgi:hypothetical protein
MRFCQRTGAAWKLRGLRRRGGWLVRFLLSSAADGAAPNNMAVKPTASLVIAAMMSSVPFRLHNF